MFSFGWRNLIRFVLVLFLTLNVILATSEHSFKRRFPAVTNNQRSADRAYKYAWFTRDVHDDYDSNDNNFNYYQNQRFNRMKLLRNLLERKYQISSESTE